MNQAEEGGDEAAGRAIVPKQEFESLRDVLSADELDYQCTEHPFAMGIFAWPVEKPQEEKTQLPLFYVSDQVAKDRSPTAHISNGSGVVSGWYVLAKPGMAFEVKVFYNPEKNKSLSSECGYFTTLAVDGQESNLCIVYKRDEWESDEVYKGFLEDRASRTRSIAGVVDKIRPFSFEKSKELSENNRIHESREIGSIKLRVYTGIVYDFLPDVRGSRVSFRISQYGTNEKVMAKEGRSLSVKSNAPKIDDNRILASFGINHRREAPEASIVIHVRETSWMRSRRLIDDHLLPCTYQKYLTLRKNDGRTPENVNEMNSSNVKRARKKRRTISSVVIDLEPRGFVPGEIIELV